MARITVEDCLEKIDNQYDLVLLAKERTVQLNAGAPILVEEDNDKRTIISLREIGDGKIPVKELEDSAIKRLRKEPDEIEKQPEIEEEVNDDFEEKISQERTNYTDELSNDFGTRLIVLPNPNYGDWESNGIYEGMNYNNLQKDSARKAKIKSY